MTYTHQTDATEPPDEELMRRVRDDEDYTALKLLIRRYEAPLFRYARHMLGNSGEAEDIFQETFIRVYERRSRFRTDGKFRPWIYRIATNLCHDRRRWWMRHPVQALDDADTASGIARSDPGAEARSTELQRAIDAAIAALPIKQRTVFVMARYQDLDYANIAAVLGIPIGTVKSRMNKAVQSLLEQLREFYP